MHGMVEKINRVYNRLQDEESRRLFDARLTYTIDKNTAPFFDAVGSMYEDWYSPQLEERLAATHAKEIIVFGSGYMGVITKRLLTYWKRDAIGFCDIDRIGETEDGMEILSVDAAVKNYPTALYIISSRTHQKEMCAELKNRGVPEELILVPKYKYLYAIRSKQYFDLFNASDDEVFVDAGSFDGGTIVDFANWTGRKHKKVFAFEPMAQMIPAIQNTVRENNISNIEIQNYAVWNRREELYFEFAAAGSKVADSGVETVQAVSIDEIVKDERVTYIKMDVEGAEMRALMGAKRTIMKNRPRLAICIYHKPEDVFEIGNFILDLVPEYKFYIRHYASNVWETVLYAIP